MAILAGETAVLGFGGGSVSKMPPGGSAPRGGLPGERKERKPQAWIIWGRSERSVIRLALFAHSAAGPEVGRLKSEAKSQIGRGFFFRPEVGQAEFHLAFRRGQINARPNIGIGRV